MRTPDPRPTPSSSAADPLRGAAIGSAVDPALDPALRAAVLARRGFLLAGLGFLAACASPRKDTVATANGGGSLPDGLWTSGGDLPPQRWARPTTPARKPATVGPESKPAPPKPAIVDGFSGEVIPRSRWSKRGPTLAEMRPMLPVTAITVHHEGMEPFLATSASDTIDRLNRVWNGHDGRGFGDIGYHFVIDRAGRIWEARSLRYQGAHVSGRNEGNIGVMCLGNFDEQSMSALQRKALEHQLRVLAARYRVKSKSVLSHQEWKGARTACPGRNLQKSMNALRGAVA
jgi:hypothetical protein